MSMHPDLQSLSDRYRELVNNVQEGHISGSDAMAALAAISVMDGHGATWQINQDGNFVRIEQPGAEPVVTDPAYYVGPETVTSNPELGAFGTQGAGPASPTWTNGPPTFGQGTPSAPAAAIPTSSDPTMAAAPTFGAPAPAFAPAPTFGTPAPTFGTPTAQSFPGQSPAPTFGAPTAPTFDSSDDPFGPGGHDPFAPGLPTAAAPASTPEWREPAAKSLSQREAKLTKKNEPSRARRALIGNKALIGIIVVAAALFGWAKFGPTNLDDPTLPALTEPTSTGAPTLPGEEVDPESTAAVTVTPSSSEPSQPSSSDVRKVVAAMTSGDRKTIATLVSQAPSEKVLATSAAFFAGLDDTGLDLKTGPLAPDGDSVLQQWQINSGDKTLTTITVTWASDGSTWKLASVPLP